MSDEEEEDAVDTSFDGTLVTGSLAGCADDDAAAEDSGGGLVVELPPMGAVTGSDDAEEEAGGGNSGSFGLFGFVTASSLFVGTPLEGCEEELAGGGATNMGCSNCGGGARRGFSRVCADTDSTSTLAAVLAKRAVVTNRGRSTGRYCTLPCAER